MRPVKFVLAVLFGAAVLVTFLKFVFFALMAGAVMGFFYLAFRGIGAMMAGRRGYAPYGPYAHAAPFGAQAYPSPYGYPQSQPGVFTDYRQEPAPHPLQQGWAKRIEVL